MMRAVARAASTGLCLAVLAACAGTSTPQSAADAKLDRPTRIYVSALDAAHDLPPIDPALAARLKRDLPGLTDDAAQIELLRRFTTVVNETTVSALRAGGLEAIAGGGERMMASDIGLMIGGKLKSADAAGAPSQARRPGGRVVADFTLTYYANTETSLPVLTFSTEPESVGQASAATRPASGPAPRLSPEVDAAARRIGRSAADRSLAFAAEKGWIKQPAVAATRR